MEFCTVLKLVRKRISWTTVMIDSVACAHFTLIAEDLLYRVMNLFSERYNDSVACARFTLIAEDLLYELYNIAAYTF